MIGASRYVFSMKNLKKNLQKKYTKTLMVVTSMK